MLKLPVPEKVAPRIVAAFFKEFVAIADKEYALLDQNGDKAPKISLFDFQMETLLYGLHCLDKAVFSYWGANYRAVFMESAFAFACEMFSEALPESARQQFLDGFKKHYNARQTEYGAMTPIGADYRVKNYLPYEFSKRLCIDADVYSPPVQIVLMEWANAIMMMMLNIAESLSEELL